VTTAKSEKELAFLPDLFISTDKGERFSELIDEHVEIPSEGSSLPPPAPVVTRLRCRSAPATNCCDLRRRK
jgi:hypothetical protein